jgi:hypothetical protein
LIVTGPDWTASFVWLISLFPCQTWSRTAAARETASRTVIRRPFAVFFTDALWLVALNAADEPPPVVVGVV